MAELVAQSDDSTHRWRRSFARDVPVLLGRSGSWPVPWDRAILRRHARLVWDGQKLLVTRIPEASNPVFYRGADVQQFSIRPGDYFVIGGTTFSLAQSAVGATLQMPDPAREQLFSRQVLNEVKFRDAEKRLAILSDLPSLIEGAASQQELMIRLVNVIFAGVDRAISIAVVEIGEDGGPMEPRSSPATKHNLDDTVKEELSLGSDSGDSAVRVLHWDRRFSEGHVFQPSQRLIQSACRKQQSILHIWEDPKALEALTMIDPSHDWAFVTPLREFQGNHLAIYVSGLLGNSGNKIDSISSIAGSLKEDIKFTELVASIAGSLIGLQELQDREAGLRRNVSTQVWNALQGEVSEARVEKRWCPLTCLFGRLQWTGTLQGTIATDQKSGDENQEVQQSWEHRFQRTGDVSQQMLQSVLEQGGVLGASRGETLLGFWGWPIPTEDAVSRACCAAWELISLMERSAQATASSEQPSLQLWVVQGMGLAGPMGQGEGSKPTILGPVVESWHRLEQQYAPQTQEGFAIYLDEYCCGQLSQQIRVAEDYPGCWEWNGRCFEIQKLEQATENAVTASPAFAIRFCD